MSVLRSKRKTAFTEFERQMALICKHTSDRLNSVPVRYQKFIHPKIYEPSSRAYTAVILANEQSARTSEGISRRNALFKEALKSIISLQKPLLSMWNLIDIKEDSAKMWADMLNREIALIFGAMKNEKEVQPMIVALPKGKIKRLAFLEKMAALHKYTYEKIGHAPNHCKDFMSGKVSDYIDTAFCEVILANHKIPETRADADKREKHLQAAIDNLNAMQRPLLALWNVMEYSEKTMDNWAGLLDEELKILEGLKKADKARYKDLR